MTNTHSVPQLNGKSQGASKRLFRFVRVRQSRKLWATYRFRLGNIVPSVLAAMLAGFWGAASALPTNGVVVGGQATISNPNSQNTLINQSTVRAAIDWTNFSIDRGQTVTFVQPNGTSVTLNRVVGGDQSAIFGAIRANGQVFLVNPNGVYFSPTATADVGALLATSLSMSTPDFMVGGNRFSLSGTGNSAAVRNEGVLRAAPGGFVILAGGQVFNLGEISTPQGTTALLAGNNVTLDREGDGLVRFSVDAGAVRALVENAGTINADGGSVALIANALQGAMSTVVNQTGVVRANSAEQSGGMIILRAIGGDAIVSGSLEAKGLANGASGGSIRVLGDRVGLIGAANLNASGSGAGGTVHVGGGYQGVGEAQNSVHTVVGSDVTINVSSTGRGRGGDAVVWSDGRTDFNGSILARGGALGGDGGNVETSGKQTLSIQTGRVDGGASQGKGGIWLLDPNDITISNNADNNLASGSPTFQNDAGNANATVNAGGLGLALTGNLTITVQTSNTGTKNGATGKITVSDPVTAAGAGTLNLIANGDIVVNDAITNAVGQALNVGLFAGSTGTPGDASKRGPGDLGGIFSRRRHRGNWNHRHAVGWSFRRRCP